MKPVDDLINDLHAQISTLRHERDVAQTALDSMIALREADAEVMTDENDVPLNCAHCNDQILAGDGGWCTDELDTNKVYHTHACFAWHLKKKLGIAMKALKIVASDDDLNDGCAHSSDAKKALIEIEFS